MTNKQLIKNSMKLSLSIIIIAFLIYKIGGLNLVNEISKIRIVYLFQSYFIFLVVLLIGVFNLKILTDNLNKIKFVKMFKYSLLSWSLGLFSMGKVGEFSIVYFLTKHRINIGKGFAVAIIDKIITFISLCIMAVVGTFYFFGVNEAAKLLLYSLLVIFGGVYIISNRRIRILVRKYILRKYENRFKGFSKTLSYFLKKRKQTLIINFLFTLLKWIITAAIYHTLLVGFGVEVPILTIIFISSVTIIASLLPISVGGLGIRESIGIYLFSQAGVSMIISASIYTIFLGMNYLTALLGALAFNNPLRLKRNNED